NRPQRMTHGPIPEASNLYRLQDHSKSTQNRSFLGLALKLPASDRETESAKSQGCHRQVPILARPGERHPSQPVPRLKPEIAQDKRKPPSARWRARQLAIW